MVRYFSTLMPSDWLYLSIILILLPKIESTPCGEVIHLDSDQPNAEITDEQYRLREIDDNNAINGGGEDCLWYFRGPPGSTIRLDIVSTTSEPLVIYDGLGVKTDVDQGIQLGGRNGNMFISSNHGVTCKLPKPSDETQEPSITLQATLQGELSIEGAIPGECGDTINLDHNSPTYQFRITNAYTSGGAAYCNWYINSPPNTMVLVEFYDWQTLDHDDCIRMYDSRGREIFYLYSYGHWTKAPHSILSDSSLRITFDAYYSVSDSSFGVKVSFRDHLQLNDVGVIPSSGGTIELNNNLTSLTIQTMNSTYEADGNMYSYWFFTGPAGRRLKVQFHQLNAGYLYVYDSSSTSKQVSGFRKPSVMPEDRIFSQNSGTLRTHFIWYEEEESSLVTISITDDYPVVGQQTCGGKVELDHYQDYFVLNSPYYYNQQSISGETDCYWYVTSPAGREVQLEWLDIETTGEYLYVSDQSYESSSYRVSKFRGNVDPDLSPFVSTHGAITIRLEDASSGMNGKGFLANVSLSDATTVVGPRSCGGTIRLNDLMPNFTLNSPYFYQPSSNAYVRCYWHVYASSGNEVEITWLEVEIPNQWLYLYDYPSSTSYKISYLRGDFDVDIPYVVSSHGGWTIEHYDDYSGNNGRGFLAQFIQRDTQYYSSSASCGGTIPLTQSSPNATFSTPYYYQTSLANVYMDCWWYISSPSGKQVHLTVLDMLTGFSERIEIYDYPTSTSSSYRVSELSGQLKSPVNVVSSRGGVTVKYDDFGSANNGPGFLFEAKIIDELPSDISGSCGGEIHLSTSIPRVSITTPLYYQGSSANVLIDCWWYVTSPSGKEVELSVHDMQTKNEYVHIYDNSRSWSQNYQISHLRGNVSDSTVVSTRGGFSIEFNDASSTGNGRGFAMDVALTDELSWDSEGIDSCGQTLHLDDSSPSISFQTPTYPVEVANDDYTCFWYFTCPYGYRISLLFNDFDTFSGSRLYVYDDDYVYSTTNRLAVISSSSLPGTAPIQSSSNQLTVQYDDADWSDVTNQRGIIANAYIIPLEDPAWDNTEPMSSCGSAIKLTDQDSSIQLSTPDYPYVSGNYYACSWFIQCPSQTAVRIDFNDFGIDSSGYIRVHDGPNTGYSVIQHSTGSNTPSSTVSSSNTMTVYYYNNFGTSGKGASFGISCVFEVDVECDSSSMTVYLDRRLLANGTQSEDIHFENVHDDGCTGRDHNNNQIVLYTRYNRCSTRLKETETKIIYSNMVTYHTPRPILGTVITRENILKIPVACELDRHRLLGDSFIPKTGEIVFNETGYGDFSLRLDRYADATFDEFADDNEGEIILGEHLYFAVNLTSVAGLSVFIENCWATPSYYPNDQKSYNFLTNGCPDDPTMAMLHSSDPSFAKFVIDAFTFIDENPQVFLHCEVLVCNDEPLSRCAQGCQSRFRRGSRHTRGTSSTPHLISNGPLSTVHSSLTAEGRDDAVVSAESGVLIGVFACITCLIVVMVAVVLYMMPKRRMLQHKYHLVNDSNEDE